jgi:uncharacterized protein (DUF2236 family)
MAWRVNREAAVFLGGGRAALMQLAHPFVAHAVEQHSATRADPQGRFVRTFLHVNAMVFGPFDAAVRAARGVHKIHERITGVIAEDGGRYRVGDPYAANDADALMWVHATLLDTAVQVYELVVGPLTDRDKERYYEESRSFAYLFGIPDAVQPRGWRGFRSYWDDMVRSDTLAAGRVARDIGRFLFLPPSRSVAPVADWYKIVTAGLLPPRFRDELGLRYDGAERALFAASVAAAKAAVRVAPRGVRYVPAYVDARRRLAGKGPYRLGRWAEKLVLRATRRPAVRTARSA